MSFFFFQFDFSLVGCTASNTLSHGCEERNKYLFLPPPVGQPSQWPWARGQFEGRRTRRSLCASFVMNTLSLEETFANLDTLPWHEVISSSAELAKNVINSFDFDTIRRLSMYTDVSGLRLQYLVKRSISEKLFIITHFPFKLKIMFNSRNLELKTADAQI